MLWHMALFMIDKLFIGASSVYYKPPLSTPLGLPGCLLFDLMAYYSEKQRVFINYLTTNDSKDNSHDLVTQIFLTAHIWSLKY